LSVLIPDAAIVGVKESMMSSTFDLAGKRIVVTGHRGMVGSAIMRRLACEGCDAVTATRDDVDLCRQSETEQWLSKVKPDAVFLAAGKVGGIYANDTFPADFLTQNLQIALNVIHGAYIAGVEKLVFLGSSCIYPRLAPQPMKEECLLSGPLESTNQWYAVAKIAGVKLCEAYRRQHGANFVSVLPSNLYGPGDNYHPQESHVPAALIRRFHEAKISNATRVSVWGTGTAKREFMSVDDLADACVFVMKNYSEAEPINVGIGKDTRIKDFAKLVAATVGYRGEIAFDASRPDGTPQKLLDVSRLAALGWTAKTSLGEGLKAAYADFLSNYVPDRSQAVLSGKGL
jgi:GDP-L-fucose synthase